METIKIESKIKQTEERINAIKHERRENNGVLNKCISWELDERENELNGWNLLLIAPELGSKTEKAEIVSYLETKGSDIIDYIYNTIEGVSVEEDEKEKFEMIFEGPTWSALINVETVIENVDNRHYFDAPDEGNYDLSISIYLSNFSLHEGNSEEANTDYNYEKPKNGIYYVEPGESLGDASYYEEY